MVDYSWSIQHDFPGAVHCKESLKRCFCEMSELLDSVSMITFNVFFKILSDSMMGFDHK